MSNVFSIRGAKEAPPKNRSSMETLLVTPDILSKWQLPPFQRPLHVNAKVRAMSEQLKVDGGIIPGVFTLGILKGAPDIKYLVDGQHRREAALLSGLTEFLVDVRQCRFDDMGEMGEEFVNLNSSIVKLRPDDILRGMEGHIPLLTRIRKECPFVGYDNIRRNAATASVSMSALLRCWRASYGETPAPSAAGKSAMGLAQELTDDEAHLLIKFMNLARTAWGGDMAYARLWSALNLTICMWLYRRLVVQVVAENRSLKRSIMIDDVLFKKCLMSLSASSDYLDWLVGRVMSERDRSPCYTRVRAAFSKRIETETRNKPKLPLPHWVSSR